MAKDDYMVIAYKILSYLHECLKAGVTPDPSDYYWFGDGLQIPQPYWVAIMEELTNHKYIKNGPAFRTTWITMDGAEYLLMNPAMQRVREFLGNDYYEYLRNLITAA